MTAESPRPAEDEGGVASPPGAAPDPAAPMSSAPFVWRQDGRPDWGSMWTSFCDLALYGGPPHRGPDQPLRARAAADARPARGSAIVAEMRRGIWETTGLYAELLDSGWIAVTCDSAAMADWIGAAIVPENVEVQVEGDRVLVPAGARFRLEDEVKSIITVVAKTHHYWTMHGEGAARSEGQPDATGRAGFRCAACDLEFRVSRPEGAADLEATCPVDGSSMVRQALVAARRNRSFWHAHGPGQPYHPHQVTPAGPETAGDGIPRPLKVGVGGPGTGKTRLIDALRRRYGRRRAIVAAADGPIEVSDPAVDVVLVELGDGREAVAGAAGIVDATIGVLDAAAVADALGRGDRDLESWHLLIVSTGDAPAANAAPGLDLQQLERDTCARRGPRPAAFVDLGAVAGVDVVVTWLQRELFLEPWRERRAAP